MSFRVFIAIALLANIYLGYLVYEQFRTELTLQNPPAAYTAGPQTADISFVEFCDYTSSNCRSIQPVLRDALKLDGNVRLVPRPIAMEESGEKYVQLVYAAGEQGKFIEMHEALMSDFRALDEGRIAELAKSLGLELDKLNRDMTSENVVQKMQENIWLAKKYATTNVPRFVTGNLVWEPATKPQIEDFISIFKEARGRL